MESKVGASGSGLRKKKKKFSDQVLTRTKMLRTGQKEINVSDVSLKPLTNIDIMDYVKKLGVKNL